MSTATRNPTSNTSPDPGQGGLAVTGNTNTGHASTTAASGIGTQTKTCIWQGFPAAGGVVVSSTLKVDFTQDGSLDAGATANQFLVEYSLNGGAAWNTLRDAQNITSPSSGTDSVSLSLSQDLTQVKVRDKLVGTGSGGDVGVVSATVSDIRIELVLQDGTVAVIIMM